MWPKIDAEFNPYLFLLILDLKQIHIKKHFW
jgi:hypothetical protein